MNAAAMYVTRWGQAGRRLVLVHGSAQGSRTGGDTHFTAQQRLAEQGWQILVPDRPGHGRSPDPGRPDDAQADGALVAELLGDGAHLAGHSFGGCVALAAAAMRPSAVHSLTVIEPAMPLLAMNKPPVLRFGLKMAMTLLLPMSDVARIRRFMKLVNIPPQLRGSDDVDELQRMGRAIAKLKLPSKKVLQQQLTEIKRAGIPLLAVSGSWSESFKAVTEVVAAQGNGRMLVIPSPHHFPQLVSDEFNQALLAFMDESDARRASGKSS